MFFDGLDLDARLVGRQEVVALLDALRRLNAEVPSDEQLGVVGGRVVRGADKPADPQLLHHRSERMKQLGGCQGLEIGGH